MNQLTCAWCRRLLRDGCEPPSHGICPTCKENLLVKVKMSLVVEQHYNPKYHQGGPKDDSNAEHLFKVLSLKNTLVHSVGTYLRPSQIETLIQQGYDVSIKSL